MNCSQSNWLIDWLICCLQVWEAPPPPALAAVRQLGADRAALLPPDYRQHSHGEAPVWHVQKLTDPQKIPTSHCTHHCKHVRDSPCCYYFFFKPLFSKSHFNVWFCFPHIRSFWNWASISPCLLFVSYFVLGYFVCVMFCSASCWCCLLTGGFVDDVTVCVVTLKVLVYLHTVTRTNKKKKKKSSINSFLFCPLTHCLHVKDKRHDGQKSLLVCEVCKRHPDSPTSWRSSWLWSNSTLLWPPGSVNDWEAWLF